MRAELARSLEAIFDRCSGLFPFKPEPIAKLIATIRSQPVRPAVFAVYTDLVECIADSDFDQAEQLADLLLQIPQAAQRTRIVWLSDDALGAGQAERHTRIVDDDPERRIGIKPTVSKEPPEERESISEALDLLDMGAPDHAGEARALMREIVLVGPGMVESPFGGASTPYLWGAITISVDPIESRLEAAFTLIHEATHLLLFGLNFGRPLVRNPQSERYRSPLRSDPRPMEGIVHAAYVLARIHQFAGALLSSGALTTEEQTFAEQEIARSSDGFDRVLATILKNARFTEIGGRIFGSAAAYMRRAPVASATARPSEGRAARLPRR